ncbi:MULTISPECIES: hypothetical protein [unclassified Microbacterium]|uniref:hypothetical protein n=1 Tax=unclassified Microbacterium TaxID=2609290 RepID=UPI003746D356
MSTPQSSRSGLSIVLFTIAAVISVGLSVLYFVEIGIGVGSPAGSWIGGFLWGAIAIVNVILIVVRVRR